MVRISQKLDAVAFWSWKLDVMVFQSWNSDVVAFCSQKKCLGITMSWLNCLRFSISWCFGLGISMSRYVSPRPCFPFGCENRKNHAKLFQFTPVGSKLRRYDTIAVRIVLRTFL